MTRSPSALVPVLLVLCAGTAAALDHEQAFAPMVVNGETPTPYHAEVDTILKSKLLEDSYVLYDDTVAGVTGSFRAYGLGVKLDTDLSLGVAQEVSRAPGTEANPLEVLRLAATIDYAVEIRDPRDTNVPLLQIIPHLSFVTYPIQRDNKLKDKQRWFGADVWWMTPIEGVELGWGFDHAIGTWRAFRTDIGAREFYQNGAVDLAFWQMLGLGDRDYRGAIAGVDQTGVTTIDVGGRATMPMWLEELFCFAQIDASYWLDSGMRDSWDRMNRDSGNVVISIGLQWLPN